MSAAEIIRVMMDDPHWQDKGEGSEKRIGDDQSTETMTQEGPALTLGADTAP